MTRDYESLLPRVLAAMFPDEDRRHEIIRKLSAYGAESFHHGRARVRLGILRLAWSRPERLDEFVDLACKDYRDLLCAAEYSLSSRDYQLKDKDPEKYKKFQEEESARYDEWLEQVLTADNSSTSDNR
jgi:hypothetical protein